MGWDGMECDSWSEDKFQEFINYFKTIQHNHTGKPTLACKYLSSAYAVRVAWLPESIIIEKVFFKFYHRKTCIFPTMTIEKTRDIHNLPFHAHQTSRHEPNYS